jgi:3-methyladenine DNA glycosylase Mpg
MAEFERYLKADLVKFCQALGINTMKKTKKELIQEAFELEKKEITEAIEKERAMIF